MRVSSKEARKKNEILLSTVLSVFYVWPSLAMYSIWDLSWELEECPHLEHLDSMNRLYDFSKRSRRSTWHRSWWSRHFPLQGNNFWRHLIIAKFILKVATRGRTLWVLYCNVSRNQTNKDLLCYLIFRGGSKPEMALQASRWEVCGAVVGRRQRDSRHSVQFPLHCNYSAGMSLTSLPPWRVELLDASHSDSLIWNGGCTAKLLVSDGDSGWAPLVKRRPSIFASHQEKFAWATKSARSPSLFPGNFKQKCGKESGFNSLPSKCRSKLGRRAFPSGSRNKNGLEPFLVYNEINLSVCAHPTRNPWIWISPAPGYVWMIHFV